MKHFLTWACLCLVLTACHKDKNEPDPAPTPTIADRTVLVYVAGENSLSKYYNSELQEMRDGMKQVGSNNHLLLYVDIADSRRKPYLLEVSAEDTVTVYQYNEGSLARDPDQMLEVINRAFALHPAKSYGLTLWGHASGWLINTDSVSHTMTARRGAYGIDNGSNSTSNNGKWMNIPTLSKVLSRTAKPLAFIFADCCNFQCAEVAYELRHAADYIIGAPSEIPGVGAPYNTLVPAMFSSDAQFYRQMADAYFAQVIASHEVPLSVVKTSEMENLAQATRTVLKSFAAQFGSGYPDMSGLIYYLGNPWSNNFKVMYDMNDFILHYASKDEYTAWRQAFDRAVVYSKMSTRWETASLVNFSDFTVTAERYGGISMFAPQPPGNIVYADYNQRIRQMGWYYAAGYADIGW